VKDNLAAPAAANGRIRVRARQQAAVASLGQRALSALDLPSLMSEAVESIALTLEVAYCNVLELIPGTDAFRLCAGVGWKGNPVEHASAAGGPESQAGYTLLSGQPVIVEDYKEEQRFKIPPLIHPHPVTSGMSVVIPGQDEPFGVLAVATTRRRGFGQEDIDFLQGIANVLAAAIWRRRTEESLRDANHRLGALIHASPLAIVSLDTDGRVRSWNVTAERMFGWREDEVVGHPDPLLFQNSREEIGDMLERVLRGETFTEVATRVPKKDGQLIDVSVSIAPVFATGGSINGIIALIADMTAHRRTEAAQEQLTEIIETTTDCVTITDVPGRGFYINKAGRRMLGIGSEDNISGVSLADIYPPDTWSFIVSEAMPTAVRDGGWSGETTLLSRSGREIPVSMVLIAHKGPDGAVQFFSTVARDISENKRFEEQLVRLANHDPLTDLYNRRRLEEEVERQLAEARRYGVHGAVLFLDLDQFKDINDSLGHLTGDALLGRVAGCLRERLRETDIIARTGGDEFAILLPHTDAEQAQVLAGNLLEALQHTSITAEGRAISVTGSIGIVLFPEHGTTVGDLFARADLAMYQAKETGRNRFGLYAPDRDLQGASQLRLSWQTRIREALERDLFVLQAQPILDLRNDRITDYELLLRMVGEKGEIIPPGAFLDTAERFGLIHAIDRWVVHRAIRLIAAHQKQGRVLSLVINLSGKAFADAELLPMITRELTETAISPRSLVLEITETAAITNIYQAERLVNTLRNLGCRVGLDDFGVGFASFYHLKHLPVDYLKIDGSFIRNLPRDPVDQQLVRAMVAVARGLGKETIAEFVSDDETVRLLRDYGVDFAQGFHIGADAGPEIVSIAVGSTGGARAG
jgi:diguanylate cyclase (GGDEF)-like protein/PAS domain S-box-containing protein